MTTTTLPIISDLSSAQKIVDYNTLISGGLFGYGIVLLVFGIVFMALSQFEIKHRLIASCFACFFISLFLAVMGAVPVALGGVFAIGLFAMALLL